jgi:Fe-S-cluster containining protein
MQHSPFPPLPCYPCPHASACCAHGTTLSRAEARAIARARGKDTVYLTRWGEYRTRVRNGRCVLLENNTCSIYNQPYYPAVCRGFPWLDAESGGPYQFERRICPEFSKRPELLQINPVRRATRVSP